jgi:transcriptional regulator with XRE-family HTH domain
MLSEAFLAKVMDLGIVLPKASVPDALTPSDQFLASIRNSAPELLLNEHPDERADLYSFGTLMYFLLRGEEIFAQEKYPPRLAKLVEEVDPEFDEKIREESVARAHLQDLCRRLLAKDPNKRPGAKEVASIIKGEREALGDEPRPLCGYIAAALTGLSPQERRAITFAGHSMARVCKTLNIYPHEPRKATDPILHSGISPESVYWFDRRRLVSADLVIAICDEPSFGVGEELEIAAGYGIPTLLVKSEGAVISRMVIGSPLNLIDDPIEYQSPEDLERKLKRVLVRHIEDLRSRKARIKKDYGAKLSQKLQDLRTAKNWTVDEAARHYGISSRFVLLMEKNPDFFHNAGLAVLTRVAGAYGLRLSDLVSEVPIGELGGPIQDDANLTLVEEVAMAQDWAIKDFIEIRNQYRSGATVVQRGKLTPEKIHELHSALLKKRLSDQGTLFHEK